MLQKYSKYGVDFEVRQRDCVRISKLDAQAEHGKTIFGHGLLLTEATAAEKAAAHVWRLSDRELEIVQGLG